jgi:hypothetical protein
MDFLLTGMLVGLGGAVLALLGTLATAWPKPPQAAQEASLGKLVAAGPDSIRVSPEPLRRALEALEAVSEPVPVSPPQESRRAAVLRVVH